MPAHSLLKVNGYFVTTFLGRSRASRGKHQIITSVYSVWAVGYLTFHKGCFFEHLKVRARDPFVDPLSHKHTPNPLVHCSYQSASTVSSVSDKGRVSGSLLSVHSGEPVRRKQEVQETLGDGVSSWLASFIRRAHGCVLINTSGTGASDPDSSPGPVGFPWSVCRCLMASGLRHWTSTQLEPLV